MKPQRRGALQACTCGPQKLAEGGPVLGDNPDDLSEAEYYRRMAALATRQRGGGRRPEALNASRNVNLPFHLARGWAAGTLGLPGDLERLGKAAWAGARAKPGTIFNTALSKLGEHPALPTSDFYQEWLPGRDEAPLAKFGGEAGALSGGVGAGRVAQGVARVGRGSQGALATLADAALMPVPRRAGQLGAVRMRGGNFRPLSEDEVGTTWIPEGVGSDNPTNRWLNKNLRNYITKHLGAPTDPLLALEKELPDLHFPEGRFGAPTRNQIDNMYVSAGNRNVGGAFVDERKQIGEYLDRHHELSGPDARLTPWGKLSDDQIVQNSAAEDMTVDLAGKWPLAGLHPDLPALGGPDSMEGLLRHTNNIIDRLQSPDPAYAGLPGSKPAGNGRRLEKLLPYRKMLEDAMATDWRMKTPEAPVYSLMGGAREDLGFSHMQDYLDTATEPYRKLKQNFSDSKALEPGGQTAYKDAVKQLLDRDGPGFDAFEGMHPYRRQGVDEWRALHQAGLLIDPESLPRMGVADVSRKTAAWNKYMAEKQNALPDELSQGWKVHKEYPDDGKGMKWVEFGAPDEASLDMSKLPEGYQLVKSKNGSLPEDHAGAYHYWVSDANDKAPSAGGYHAINSEPEKAVEAFWKNYREEKLVEPIRKGLKAEGDTMGHCVGGYCDDVLKNGTKIYSLRDAKGRPHVTIEVSPPSGGELRDILQKIQDPDSPAEGPLGMRKSLHDRANAERGGNGDYPEHALRIAKQFNVPLPQNIVQIKGKQNAAPIADYLPYVQDFVKGGQWGRVGDLSNTGLVKHKGGYDTKENLWGRIEAHPRYAKLKGIHAASPYEWGTAGHSIMERREQVDPVTILELLDKPDFNLSGVGGAANVRRFAQGGTVQTMDAPAGAQQDHFDELDHAIDVTCINCEEGAD